ncbi:MAG: hypothetical protein LBH40_03005 [Alphaproteobacteria bacterium]|jgi:hypothetical protein|nr:hypothetical protein [Alphaproteobacteria bacterium]
MKKLLGIFLSVLVLSPSLALAEATMIEIDGDYVNKNSIHVMKSKGKDGCIIHYSIGSSSFKYPVDMSCEQFMKEKEISSK